LHWIAVMAVAALSPAARAASGEREALRKAVDQLLAQPPLAGAHVSVEVDALEDGQSVVSHNADDLLNPASNTKLITSAAALLRLGPEYRFTTDYLSERAIQRGRVGTLYVRGRGDPSVNTERIDALAADLWHRGLRSVRDIVLDDSFFDREEFGPGWEQETSDKAWAAGVGALSLNHNTVAVYITPADRPNSRARVEVEPDARDYFITASPPSARTAAASCGRTRSSRGSARASWSRAASPRGPSRWCSTGAWAIPPSITARRCG
jgi:D-alanyl-D-alanine carboxypeptidase/D-alanyl-D-alanine-endopeptidase (penicillin-binding protein 4)